MFKFNPFEIMTVKNLYEFCKDAIDKGYGDKKILLADEHYEKFHTLHHGFTLSTPSRKKIYNNAISDEDYENLITLG